MKRIIRYLQVCILLMLGVFYCAEGYTQYGYIYVHQKNINEEASVDFNFALKNSGGTTINTWQLNDQPTFDNVYNSNRYAYTLDIGAAHGAGVAQLWTLTPTAYPGSFASLMYKDAGSSKWKQVSIPILTKLDSTKLDGAYLNQCVVGVKGTPYFYNNGAFTALPAPVTAGTALIDIAAGGGRIAAIGKDGYLYVYSGTYTATTAPVNNGTWTVLSTTITGSAGSARIDIDATGTYIYCITANSNAISKISIATGTITSLGNAGDGAVSAGSSFDIAVDDNDYVYATVRDAADGGTNVVATYNGSTWKTERTARDVYGLTAAAAHAVWGIESTSTYFPSGSALFRANLWYRAVDNTGATYWIDDERVKNSSSLNGNGVMIPVSPGTYTIQETLPNSNWDLGRFNLYDPGGAPNVQDVANSKATVTVTAGEVVYVEFVNELLTPAAIPLNCNTNYLQSFDKPTYGNGTNGDKPFGGTSYHFMVPSTLFGGTVLVNAGDGLYSLVSKANSWDLTNTLTEHTGNGGYMMLINASYATDEFFRQRVTNLLVGQRYAISFWASNISPWSPLAPNVYFGLQDASGNILNSTVTGNIPLDKQWHQYTFTFTAKSTTADVFLRNQGIGGNGNDLVIDDIALNPIVDPLPNNTVTGPYCVGKTFTVANTVSGGVWSATPANILTVNSSGVVSTLAAGAGTVTYTYTNSINCVTSTNTSVTVNAIPSVTASASLTNYCNTNGSFTVTANATGGNGAYTNYTWATTVVAAPGTTSVSPVSSATNTTTATITDATGGTSKFQYAVTVTDGNGCTASGATVVNVAAPLSITTATATASSICYPATGSIALNAVFSNGTAPYSYTWAGTTTATPSTVAIASPTGTTSPASATATTSGVGTYTFTFTVKDANNCSATKVPAAVQLYGSPALTLSSSATTVCRIPTATITLTGNLTTATVAPYTYNWLGSGVVNNKTSATTTAKPGTSGYYILSITDARGCTGNASTPVTLDPATPVFAFSCNTNANGVRYGILSETNGTSWLWTSGTGNKFYSTPLLGTSNDASTSTSQTTYISSRGNYTVAIVNSAGCNGSGTITIDGLSACGQVLSDNRLDFTVSKQGYEAILNWSALTGAATSYFSVERSDNGREWTTLAKVAGAAAINGRYTYKDVSPLANNNYYRVKAINAAGEQIAISQIKLLGFNSVGVVKLYPNPSTSFVMLDFSHDRDEAAELIVQDLNGKTLFSSKKQLAKGSNHISVTGISALAQGIYTVKLITASNQYTAKLVKSN